MCLNSYFFINEQPFSNYYFFINIYISEMFLPISQNVENRKLGLRERT